MNGDVRVMGYRKVNGMLSAAEVDMDTAIGTDIHTGAVVYLRWSIGDQIWKEVKG